MRAGGLLLLLVLLAPLPAAHAHAAFDGGALLGDASAHLELTGAPIPSAMTPMQARVRTDWPGAIEARLLPPEGPPGAWFPLREEDGRRVAPLVLPHEGRWGVELRAGAHAASFRFDVWPAAGVFVEPVGEAATGGVVLEGQRARVLVRLVDAAGHPVPPPADARARIEGPGGDSVAPLAAEGGVLAVERTWDEPGEYRIHVASPSLRLAEGARPPVRLLVVPAEDAAVYGLAPREVPLGALPALAALALLACALARRR